MSRSIIAGLRRRLAAAALLAALAGCAPGPTPSTFALPNATLAPLRLVPCPARLPAAARATSCPTPSDRKPV